MKKRISAVVFAMFILLSTVIPVFATSYGNIDMDYSGELDTESGRPVTDPTNPGSSANRISIGDGTVYDTAKNRYCYSVDGGEVEMNFPSGVVTTDPVSITVSDGMTTRLFRNGTEIPDADISSISTVGKYILRFSETETTYLSFTIVKQLTGLITGYQLPVGFTVTSATLDGSRLEASSYVDMSREGNYIIKYKCEKTGVSHSLNVTIDNTPPTLKLEAVKDGYAKGPVDISDMEEGAAVSIVLNGEKIKYEDVLTQSGSYSVIVQDEAGNTSTFNFVIGVYFNLTAGIFVVVIILLLAALAVYLILSRKKMRVR